MNDDLSLFDAPRRKIEADIAERTRAHQEKIGAVKRTMAVKRLRAATPKTAVAVGDSWFDYPLWEDVLPGQTDIIAQLEHMHSFNKLILRLAHHGDATSDMMTPAKQRRLINALADPGNWINGKPDVIFCSAGGNDVAGNHFWKFIRDNEGQLPSDGLDVAAFNQVLDIAKMNYRTLFRLRDDHAPGVTVIAHAYDFPTPDGRAPACAGPWLKPSLDQKGWSVPQGKIIVTDALKRFRTMLKGLQAQAGNNFYVVETQGTFRDPNYRRQWINELHPNAAGFELMAEKCDEHWLRLMVERGEMDAAAGV